jgi:hypothetical protein
MFRFLTRASPNSQAFGRRVTLPVACVLALGLLALAAGTVLIGQSINRQRRTARA